MHLASHDLTTPTSYRNQTIVSRPAILQIRKNKKAFHSMFFYSVDELIYFLTNCIPQRIIVSLLKRIRLIRFSIALKMQNAKCYLTCQ